MFKLMPLRPNYIHKSNIIHKNSTLVTKNIYFYYGMSIFMGYKFKIGKWVEEYNVNEVGINSTL